MPRDCNKYSGQLFANIIGFLKRCFYSILDVCMYLYKKFSRLNAYNCVKFRSGCPKYPTVSTRIFECKYHNACMRKDIKTRYIFLTYVCNGTNYLFFVLYAVHISVFAAELGPFSFFTDHM